MVAVDLLQMGKHVAIAGCLVRAMVTDIGIFLAGTKIVGALAGCILMVSRYLLAKCYTSDGISVSLESLRQATLEGALL